MKGARLGKAVESLVCDKLREIGMVILDQNYKVGNYEIDIIAMDGRVLTFVEVKARSGFMDMEEVMELLTPAKERRLVIAADTYCNNSKETFDSCRFDYVFVDMSGERYEILHYKEAFVPTSY
ncbi:YraN family protein [Porphyromonas sp.]|uniref:YraN family protein n=1 Tax=Porphyromonas sp. TaxID=1924944 RepID=UPI0026DC6989|nr:YraN family protein [Porphyromonas sp.]MDO4771911.1 YraN family protein [Porphyromonas sp.]